MKIVTVGMLMPKTLQTVIPGNAEAKAAGWLLIKPSVATLKILKDRFGAAALDEYDQSRVYTIEKADKGAALANLKILKAGLRAILVLTSPSSGKDPVSVSILQEETGQLVGGSTFVLRNKK